MSGQLSTNRWKGAFCIALACLASSSSARALDMPPPDLHRTNEYGMAVQAAAVAFDNDPIEGIKFFDEGTYQVWSKTCSAEVVITYPFDELEPLSVPDASSVVRSVECQAKPAVRD